MNPTLSIVTGTRNRPDDIRRLTASIERFTDVSYEVIIADASDAPSVPYTSWTTVLVENPRLGYAKGCNVALRRAKGKYTLLLNDDCEVTRGYSSVAVSFMERNPAIGIGALAYSNKGGPFMVNSHEGMIYANFPILATELGNRIGWLDEDLPMYASDNALNYRVLMAGYGIAEVSGARILHYETDDIHRRENNNYAYRVEQAERLRAKYGQYFPMMRETYDRCRMVLV